MVSANPFTWAKEILRRFYLRLVYFPFVRPKPPQFTRCWQYPLFEPTMVKGFKRPLILIYPMNDWHTRQQRPHFLAHALVRFGYQCLWINPNLGREFPGLFDRGPSLSCLADHILELHVRLPREPVFHARMLTAGESDRVAEAVCWALTRLDSTLLGQVVQLPIWSGAAESIKRKTNAAVIYDCHDFIPGFQGMAVEISSAEITSMNLADHVVFSSGWLRERFSSMDDRLITKSSIIRNAGQPMQLPLLDTRNNLSEKPVILYVGAIEDWFDEQLVAAAAQRLPDCQFLIGGRVDERRVLSIDGLANVTFLGEVPASDVPGLLRRARVGLIPFRVNDLTLAANPLKLYEYFWAGLPVVSTRLPEVTVFGDLVYIADGAPEFGLQVEAALREEDRSLQQRRISVATSETWDQRAESFLSLLTAGRLIS